MLLPTASTISPGLIVPACGRWTTWAWVFAANSAAAVFTGSALSGGRRICLKAGSSATAGGAYLGGRCQTGHRTNRTAEELSPRKLSHDKLSPLEILTFSS